MPRKLTAGQADLPYPAATRHTRVLGEAIRKLYRDFYSLPSMVSRLPLPLSQASIASWVINFSQRRMARAEAVQNNFERLLICRAPRRSVRGWLQSTTAGGRPELLGLTPNRGSPYCQTCVEKNRCFAGPRPRTGRGLWSLFRVGPRWGNGRE